MNWLRRIFFWRQSRKDVVAPSIKSEFLILNVFAKSGAQFASYELLQVLLAAGLQFGEMNIFHYYDPDRSDDKYPLFSLASATEPGDFNLQKIGEISCQGLTLFMDIHKVRNPMNAFNVMLSVAEELAEELDGELCAAPGVPWTLEKALEYQQRIEA